MCEGRIRGRQIMM